ncbi:MAG: M20 aminoacylase family protein [Acetobacterales bacterium]
MPVVNRIAEFLPEMTGWRQDLHAHPETAFKEYRTAGIVADRLKSFGIEVHTGLAGTGVVGKLVGGSGRGRAIGLRADMDALPMTEANPDLPYRSTSPGSAHACGHDGHTTMLLGAARYLAENPNFDGTVYFIFQPAEENEAGGQVMVEDGLFEQFPMEQVFGLHNWPELPAGRFAARPGPIMAGADNFEITVRGRGGHAAMPHLNADPVVCAAQLVLALQTVVSRNTDASDALVLTVTQFHAGEAWNVTPGSVVLRGTVRYFDAAVQDRAEARIREMSEQIAGAFGCAAESTYIRRYPPTINNADETDICMRIAGKVVGDDNVSVAAKPCMGAEDFAYMLQKRPGCYIWMGAGREGPHNPMVHSPDFNFNDDMLPVGASYWTTLVETLLPRES